VANLHGRSPTFTELITSIVQLLQLVPVAELGVAVLTTGLGSSLLP